MLRLENVSKRFADVAAVRDVSLQVERGELLTLLGPSGCGKTTTLRMIAGFEPVTGGRIVLDGRDVTGVSPQRRRVGMVFQNYALFPHLDVFENIAFGLKAQDTARDEIPRRVERALDLVDLRGYARRRVQALSGGQQQRVALARALAPEPPILLLDEPLSNLDATLRERTREELRAVLRRIGITAVFVTHDQEEAFALSDRIALMNAGRIEQLGSPEDLYHDPITPFAAGFVGRASFLPARVTAASNGRLTCEIAPGVAWPALAPPGGVPGAGEAALVMARPEQLGLRAEASNRARPQAGGAGTGAAVATSSLTPPSEDEPASGGPAPLPATVLDRRFAGAVAFYRVRASLQAGDTELLVQGAPEAASAGQAVEVRPLVDVRAYPAQPTPALSADEGASQGTRA